MCAAAAVLAFESRLAEGAVQIAPGLLEEIRDRVLDGYAAAPHGGVEVGFVLLGCNTESGIVIQHFREIPCAHLLSPRFLLSPEEESDFPEWMRKLSADPEMEGAEPIGWCCSHNRSDLALLDREIAFHRRHFSQQNQFVMVAKPESMQAVAAGIFLPDEHGAIRAESPTIRVRSALLDSVPGSASKTTNERQPNILKALEFPGRSPVSQKKRRFRVSGWWIGIVAGSAVLAAFLALVLPDGFHLLGNKSSPQPLSLTIRPQGNDLIFTWNGDIDRVESANIQILDGSARSHFDITSSFQRSGVFVFPHRTGNVQVVLKVRTNDRELVRTVGFVDGRQSAEDRSMVEADASSSAAARLDATNRRLAALVSVLQSRWKPREK